jgi:hypothetical protein
MNIIKKSDLMEFVSNKKQMLLSKKMESAAEPAVAPPKTKPGTKPGTKPTPSTPKYPKPAVTPKPKAMAEPAVAPPKIKPGTKPAPSTPKYPKPAVNPPPKAKVSNIGEEMKMSKKVKINKKYPKKFVKEHINSYFCVDVVNETIGNDYSVELQLVGEKSELVKCLKNLKEGNVIN